MSIIIPIYARLDLTKQCLRSLERTIDVAYDEVIVVDNASSDGSGRYLAAEEPWVRLISNDRNLGFAKACNQGAAAASHDLLVFLNNDTEGHPGWADAMVDTLCADERVGVVGCKLLFPDGTLQHAGVLVVDDDQNGILNAFHRWYREDPDRPGADDRAELHVVTGAVLGIHRDLFEQVGRFDESYWNGCEDIDLCLSVRAAGRTVVYEPRSVLTHHESASGPERFTKVTENLVHLTRRWRGRVDADFAVRSDANVMHGPFPRPGAVDADPVPSGPTVAWRGPLFSTHHMSIANRELGVRLWADHGMRIDPFATETPTMLPADDVRLAPMVRRALAGPPPTPDVVVQHQWPPVWKTPAGTAPWVVMQPWEYGCLPQEWVAPLRDEVDEYWVPSTWQRDCAVASGVPAHKVHVVPFAVDRERLSPDGPRHPLTTTARTRLLFLGGANHRSALDVAINSYLTAFDRTDDVCLVLALAGGPRSAEGVAAARVRDFAARAGMAEIEIVDRWLDDHESAALLRACTAVLYPNRCDSVGLPVAEAVAMGLPVITTRTGGMLDLCDDDSAYLVDVETVRLPAETIQIGPAAGAYWTAEPDRAQLAAAMRRVHDDPDDAARRGRLARRRALERPDWDQVAATVAERLQRLTTRPARRLDPLGAFDPAVVPTSLDDRRRTAVLLEIDLGGAWTVPFTSWVETFGDDDDVTLVAVAEEEADLDLLGAYAGGFDGDVLVVLTGGEDHRTAAAYAACDAVLTGRSRNAAARAAHIGRPTVSGLSASDLRAELYDALASAHASA